MYFVEREIVDGEEVYYLVDMKNDKLAYLSKAKYVVPTKGIWQDHLTESCLFGLSSELLLLAWDMKLPYILRYQSNIVDGEVKYCCLQRSKGGVLQWLIKKENSVNYEFKDDYYKRAFVSNKNEILTIVKEITEAENAT